MSEMKAVHAFDVYEAYTKTGDDDAAQVYLKSEADKVIAELEKKLDIYKRGWMENDKVNANQYAEIRHHKYKRCLGLKEVCLMNLDYAFRDPCIERSAEGCVRWRKWANRWHYLAQFFKEAK